MFSSRSAEVSRWLRTAALALSAAVVTACAPLNSELVHPDPMAGHRPPLEPVKDNSDEVLIALALSGGGTRAAALSYGVLAELDRHPVTVEGTHRTLLDEVDLLSSVSGGSFAAAYFALFGKQALHANFRSRFLDRDIQGALVRRTLLPWNWFRLASPYFSRIDLAAELYDSTVFEGKRFADLPRKPFLMLNATNMSQSSNFVFTQEQFDVIGSDLSDFLVGRAVAASSAFPFLLSPITLKNYGAKELILEDGEHVRFEPGWIDDSLDPITYALDRQRYHTASNWRELEDAAKHPYLHLLDGGLADNLGARQIVRTLQYPTFWFDRLIQAKKVKQLILVSVNARGAFNASLDESRSTPGLLDVLFSTGSSAMDNYTDETIVLMERAVAALRESPDGTPREATEDPDCERNRTCSCFAQLPWFGGMKVYNITVELEAEQDPVLRQKLMAIGTNFSLDKKEIDLLIEAGGRLLQQDPCFQLLKRDLH